MFSLRVLRIKAMQQLFSVVIQKKSAGIALTPETFSTAERQAMLLNLPEEVEKVRLLHSSFLQLLTYWAVRQDEQAALLIQKPDTPLAEDTLLTALRSDHSFLEHTQRYPAVWKEKQANAWYYTYVKPQALFSTYPSPDQQAPTLLASKLIQLVFKTPEIQTAIGTEDICWNENRPIVYALLKKFVKTYATDPAQSFELYTSPLPAEKVTFYDDLLTHTVDDMDRHGKLLHDRVANWSLERIHPMDQVLIRMALTEIEHFPHIPLKVSINEYLEIAKQYSTPKSAAFINGVVDRLAREKESPTS